MAKERVIEQMIVHCVEQVDRYEEEYVIVILWLCCLVRNLQTGLRYVLQGRVISDTSSFFLSFLFSRSLPAITRFLTFHFEQCSWYTID